MDSQHTPRCPVCGYEYEPWVAACPDCGAFLVTGHDEPTVTTPTLEPGVDPRWSVVTNVPNSIIGNLIKAQLEDAGIPVLMNRSPSVDVGEFSHNDYVPQDLRVPQARWHEARSLVDSRPDMAHSVHMANDWDVTPEEEPDGVNRYSPAGPELPDGWTLLPGTSEMYERGRLTRGGYDDPGQSRVYRVDASDLPPNGAEDDGYTVNQGDTRWQRETFEEDPYSDWQRQKWVRIFYGILILAITLPFLMQLLGQLAQFFGR